MKVTAGSRWKSAVCATEVVVVKGVPQDAEFQCGGKAMLATTAERPAGAAPAAGMDAGTLLGKRYGDDASGLEVLCVKGGGGTLGLDGRALVLRATKALPSSD
jgi:hypothetical protein